MTATAFPLNRTAFTFTNYDLQLRVEPGQQRLAVRGKITLRNDSPAPQKDLCLQISSSLDWRSISIAGKPVEFVSEPYISDIDHTGALSEAIVSLPQAIPPKATIELEIGYEGVILTDTTSLTRIGVPENTAAKTDWDQIGRSFSAVRGIGYVVWYPVGTEAANLSQENSVAEAIGQWRQREAAASMRVDVCLWQKDGSPVSALMNDWPAPTAETNDADAATATQCHEHVFAALGETVPLFAIGSYGSLANAAVNIAYLPEHKNVAGSYASAAANALPFVTSWFGPPRQKARLAELSDSAAAPYENGGMLLTPLGDIDPKLAEIAMVHQLAHAAFPSPRLWIYEGVAHFAQAAYRERQSNRESALHFMDDHLPAMVETEKDLAAERGKDSAGQPLIQTGIEELYRSKAMYVWWMLRDMVGESVLKQVLAAYRPEKDTEPSYLQHLFEAQSKLDLAWFFDDWVYHDRGLPDFRIVSVYPSEIEKGSYMATVTVENLGEAGAEVPVTIAAADGEITKRLRVLGKSRASIRIVVPSLPERVVVNDGSVPESDATNNTFSLQKQ